MHATAPEVVVIGAGLSGLAAAASLSQQPALRVTLIEVKPRVGGSIRTERRGGFALDSGPMLSLDAPDAAFLRALGLSDAVHVARQDERGAWLAFNAGTGALIDALRLHVSGTRMQRMAVSSLGRTADGFSICLENGLIRHAQALIVALPAPYAARVFHTLKPEISHLLSDYRYDPLVRVSMGYPAAALPPIPDEPPPDYPISALHHTAHPARVPPGGRVIQAAVRIDPDKGVPPDLVGEVAALFGFPANPLAEHVAYWPQSDPIMWLDEAFGDMIAQLHAWLPEGVALTGSDYLITEDHMPTLSERYAHGITAARQVLRYLKV